MSSIVDSAIGAGIGMVTTPLSKLFGITDTESEADQRQQNQASALMGIQLQGQQQSADIQRKSAEQLMTEQYQKQVQGMNIAGLNPALMYGAGGVGGATQAGGQMPSAGSAADSASTENASSNQQQAGMQAVMNGMQEAVMETQAEKNKADANLSNTQAENISGAQTENQNANTENTKTKTTGEKLKNSYQDIMNNIAEQTKSFTVQKAQSDMFTANNQADITTSDALVKSHTNDTRIAQAEADVANTIADTLLKQSNNNLTKEQATSVANTILQKWKDLQLQQQKQGAEHTDRQAMLNTILKAAGIQAVGNIANTLTKAGVQ